MTADLPTHPSTEAVGEVRRREVEHAVAEVVGVARAGELLTEDDMRDSILRHRGWTSPTAATALRKALARSEAQRDKAVADLSAMTSDRDWLRGEFERVTAEAANLWGERDAAMRNWNHIQDEWERALPVLEAAETWRANPSDPEVVALLVAVDEWQRTQPRED